MKHITENMRSMFGGKNKEIPFYLNFEGIKMAPLQYYFTNSIYYKYILNLIMNEKYVNLNMVKGKMEKKIFPMNIFF